MYAIPYAGWVHTPLRNLLSTEPLEFPNSVFPRGTHPKRPSLFRNFFLQEEEPWKVRRAKQQAKLKAKSKEDKKANRDAGGGKKGGTGAAVAAAGGDDDPDTAHWGELLEDAKREAEGGGGGGEKAGGAGESSDNTSEAAQQKKAKKKNKKKRGLQWNKKATNLWVYVKGESMAVAVVFDGHHYCCCCCCGFCRSVRCWGF